ncbi:MULTISPECIES: hypothetical protein [Clostridium]|uniref:hypothetical protein n=1 Tax=Clostridium TaxID=1485 RepID=UPI001111B1D4|nr:MULTISPECIES: hypothetical protein [Clostridium]
MENTKNLQGIEKIMNKLEVFRKVREYIISRRNSTDECRSFWMPIFNNTHYVILYNDDWDFTVGVRSFGKIERGSDGSYLLDIPKDVDLHDQSDIKFCKAAIEEIIKEAKQVTFTKKDDRYLENYNKETGMTIAPNDKIIKECYNFVFCTKDEVGNLNNL